MDYRYFCSDHHRQPSRPRTKAPVPEMKTPKTPTFQEGMTFPPFVDAYQSPHGAKVGWTFHDFAAALKRTASRWSPDDCQRLTGKPVPKIGKALVLACGWWGDARYVLLDDPTDKARGWYVVRHNYPDDWDQT